MFGHRSMLSLTIGANARWPSLWGDYEWDNHLSHIFPTFWYHLTAEMMRNETIRYQHQTVILWDFYSFYSLPSAYQFICWKWFTKSANLRFIKNWYWVSDIFENWYVNIGASETVGSFPCTTFVLGAIFKHHLNCATISGTFEMWNNLRIIISNAKQSLASFKIWRNLCNRIP